MAFETKTLLFFAYTVFSSMTVVAGCTGTISSLNDVAAAVKCTTVNINSFTVPAGQTFSLSLASGSTVNMCKSEHIPV